MNLHAEARCDQGRSPATSSLPIGWATLANHAIGTARRLSVVQPTLRLGCRGDERLSGTRGLAHRAAYCLVARTGPTARRALLLVGWTRDDLAEKSGVFANTIQHLESGTPTRSFRHCISCEAPLRRRA